MFEFLSRARERRRLEIVAPNPRGLSPLRPAKRRPGRRVLMFLLLALGMGGGALIFTMARSERLEIAQAPGGGFHACGNGRWVQDRDRCL
ncbi:hypothetical protein LCM17_20780 [Cereibacter sphaeroides]|nr:hypothetical protein [Cereibacter sphaeroides]